MTNAIDVENAVTRLIIFAAMAAGSSWPSPSPMRSRTRRPGSRSPTSSSASSNRAVRLGSPRRSGNLRARRAARAVVPGGRRRRARRRLRRSRLPRVGLARVARHRRRRDAHRRARGVARLAVALRGALRADRDHRARRVDRRDRDRDVGARARHDVRAVGGRRLRRCRGAVVGVLRLHGDRGRALAERRRPRRGPLARDVFTYFHYPVVLGIIFYAVAAKKTLEHPRSAVGSRGWALGLGIAVFLVGFALMRFRVIRRVAWERLGAPRSRSARGVARRGGRDRDARRRGRRPRRLGRGRERARSHDMRAGCARRATSDVR